MTFFLFVLSPLLAALLAYLFLHNRPEFAVGLILTGTVPCAGMVAAWTGYAKGNVALALATIFFSLLTVLVLALKPIIQISFMAIFLRLSSGLAKWFAHGHKCPAMPLGLRAGEAAMQVLGVQHAPDGQLTALVEIDRNHCSTCFADGMQVITGCTLGKGSIRSLGYGKFALTLIDNKTGRSVRVVATPEVMCRSQESEFIQYRKNGAPASQVPCWS